MSIETAEFLLQLLGNLQLRVGGDDFDDGVTKVLAARDALRGIVSGELVVLAVSQLPLVVDATEQQHA